MSHDDFKAAVLVQTEEVFANGGLVHPRPRRPGSQLKTFEPSLWEARCPDCRTLIALIRQVRTDITARGPYVHPDAPDNPNDGASAEFHIGTVVTLEPGFVNASRRTQVASSLERPTYQLSNRRTRTPALRIRKPAIVVCKCGCRTLLDWPKGHHEYASATEEERAQMAFGSFEESDEREYGTPIRQLMKDRNLTLAEAIREFTRGRKSLRPPAARL
jgi:hypothetical protein